MQILNQLNIYKILKLNKSTDHRHTLVLQGATIRRDDATGAVIVARIMRGGAADRSGELVPLQVL